MILLARVILATLGLAAGTQVLASTTTDLQALAAAKRALQRGVNNSKADSILQARRQFQALAAVEPKSARLHYWMAVADWRATPLLMRDTTRSSRERAKKRCLSGLKEAQQALDLDPGFGEALALKAGLQGLSLSFGDPSEGPTVGMQMESDLGRALGMAANNPRVHLLDGLNTLHKPAFVGGGPAPALAKLRRAIELFAADTTADAAAPDWGHDDACLWAGHCAMQLQDHGGARDYFREALVVNPDNAWVRYALLPEAEREAAKRGAAQPDTLQSKP